MRPYSQQILLALDQHGRLNCRQLAGKISHEFSKTKDLVGYMRQNGKLITDGTIDDMVSYSLSAKGRAEAERLRGAESSGSTITHRQTESAAAGAGEPSHNTATQPVAKAVRPRRPQVAPRSLEDVMHNVNNRADPKQADDDEPRSAPAATTVSPNSPINARFGLLNTGELVIMPDLRATIVLSADVTRDLRAALAGNQA